MTRVVTAIIAVPILLAAIWITNPYFFVALATAAALIALFEFYRISAKTGAMPQEFVGYVTATTIALAFVMDHRPWIITIIIGSTIAALTFSLVRPEDAEKSILSVGSTILGIVYVALPAGCLIAVKMIRDTYTQPPTPHLASKLLSIMFAMVIMADTGAYYVGRSLGKHKLAPRISPGRRNAPPRRTMSRPSRRAAAPPRPTSRSPARSAGRRTRCGS